MCQENCISINILYFTQGSQNQLFHRHKIPHHPIEAVFFSQSVCPCVVVEVLCHFYLCWQFWEWNFAYSVAESLPKHLGFGEVLLFNQLCHWHGTWTQARQFVD